MTNPDTGSDTGLEPITNSGTALDIVFNLPVDTGPEGPNDATLADDPLLDLGDDLLVRIGELGDRVEVGLLVLRVDPRDGARGNFLAGGRLDDRIDFGGLLLP